jgi:ABC-type antimicrobial peptide transport system permease subunit
MLSGRVLSMSVAPGGQKPEPARVNTVHYDGVGSGFFETMSIPILYGRAIGQRDTFKELARTTEPDSAGRSRVPDGSGGRAGPVRASNGPPAAVVNLEFARRFFQTENPVGMTFTDSLGVTFEIVGVIADARLNELREPDGLTFYSSLVETQRNGVTFEVKIAGDEAGAVQNVVNQIRQAVRSVDSSLTITDVRTQAQQIEDGLSQERLMASLAAVFGVLALILASIGIYGVMAYAVARRTNEIGIRVALGARPGGVAWLVLRETLVLAAAGVAIGIPAVLVLSPVLDHVLAPAWRDSFAYGLRPNDPFIIAAAVSVLAVAGASAGYFPARRAARVDPMTALRHD